MRAIFRGVGNFVGVRLGIRDSRLNCYASSAAVAHQGHFVGVRSCFLFSQSCWMSLCLACPWYLRSNDPSVGTSHTPVLKSPVRHKDRRLLVSSGETSTRFVLLMLGIEYQVHAFRYDRIASALNRRRILRFQRIDIRNRRRMFRPTAEIARRESRYQVSNQYSVEALPAARRDPC